MNQEQKDHSFEYQPIQTEMFNDISSSFQNKDKNYKLSDVTESENNFHESNNEEEEYSNILLDSKLNINNLQSVRISHSIVSPKNNEDTLLERMQFVTQSISKKEKYTIMKTPPKKNSNNDGYHNIQENKNKTINEPCTIRLYKNMFDGSETDNKKVIVSELDIQINSNNKDKQEKKKEKKEKEKGVIIKNIAVEYDKKNKKGIDLRKVFEKNSEMPKQIQEQKFYNNKDTLQINLNNHFTHRNNIPTHYITNLTQNDELQNLNNRVSSQKKSNISQIYTQRDNCDNNKEICGLFTTELERRHKAIYSSVKKLSSKLDIFNLINKNSSSKAKATNSFSKIKTSPPSNRSSSLTNKNTNTNSKTKDSYKYNSSNTVKNPPKNKKYFIPIYGVKPKKPIPEISKFTYYTKESSKYIKKPSSLNKNTIDINNNNNNNNKNFYSNSLPKNNNKQILRNNSKKKGINNYNFNQEILQTLNNSILTYNNIKTASKTHNTNLYFSQYNKANQDNHITSITQNDSFGKNQISKVSITVNSPIQIKQKLLRKTQIKITKNNILNITITPMSNLRTKMLNPNHFTNKPPKMKNHQTQNFQYFTPQFNYYKYILNKTQN